MASPEPTSGGGVLGYDPASMARGLAATDGATAEVRTLLGTIQQEVGTLSTTWIARSSTAFSQVHAKWAERAALINGALQTMHEKLAAAELTYTKTEQAQVDQYQALANSI